MLYEITKPNGNTYLVQGNENMDMVFQSEKCWYTKGSKLIIENCETKHSKMYVV